MKRTLTLLAATLLVASLAPVASATDGIGIFFDEAGTINCSAAPALYSSVNLYIVAKNISSTASGLSGWECGLMYEPATLMIPPSYTILNGMLNVMAPPMFSVGGFPVAYADAIPLAMITIVYTGTPIKIGMGPTSPSSFSDPTGPGYAVGDDPGILRVLYPVSNTPTGTANFYWLYYLGVTTEPCPGSPVATEENSWGNVKTLFK